MRAKKKRPENYDELLALGGHKILLETYLHLGQWNDKLWSAETVIDEVDEEMCCGALQLIMTCMRESGEETQRRQERERMERINKRRERPAVVIG